MISSTFEESASGLPKFEIQSMFAQMASAHEPAIGLGTGMNATMSYDDATPV